MKDTSSTSTAAATRTTPALQRIRPFWRWAARAAALAGLWLRELGHSLTSAAFFAHVMTPFAGWALLLLWAHARYPDLIVQAVADGPAIVVELWVIVAGFGVVGAFGLGRYRQARTIMLAIAALMLIATKLPPLPTRTLAGQAQLPHP